MARINVEDSIYRDPRFVRLCAETGSMEAALGSLILIWDEAQLAFRKGSKYVPIEALSSKLKHFQALVNCGFIRLETDELAYVSGSEKAFDYLQKKREAAAAGGKKSGEVRKKKKERSKTKQKQPNPTELNPSSSSSISSSVIPFPTETGIAPLAIVDRNPVALWVKAYAEKYKVRYAFQKQDFGYLKNAGEVHGSDRLEVLFACYLAIDEKLYANAKHPLSLFFRDLQKISVAAQTGINPALPERFDVSRLRD